jgi:hypothetical protein
MVLREGICIPHSIDEIALRAHVCNIREIDAMRLSSAYIPERDHLPHCP